MEKIKVYQIELKPSYLCNQKCIFCLFEDRKKTSPMTEEEVKRNLEYIKNNFKFNCFHLSGGEPTLRKDFFYILDYITHVLKIKKVVLHTNALLLSHKKFVKKLRKYPLECFVSFHTTNSKLHQKLTNRKENLNKIINGIKNLKRYNIRVWTDTIILKQNYKELPKIANFLMDLNVDLIEFRFPILFGNAKKNINRICPPFAEAKVYLKKAIDIIAKRSGKVIFTTATYCFFDKNFMKKLYKLRRKNQIQKYVFFDKNHQFDNFSLEFFQLGSVVEDFHKDYVKIKKCKNCSKFLICKGVPRNFINKKYDAFYPLD